MTRGSLERPLCSILSGLLLSASFAPSPFGWAAWVALVPLLRAIKGTSHSRAFKLGFLAGFVHYLTLIYWIVVVLEHYGGLNALISMIILVLFCLYLSVYPALFASLVFSFRGSSLMTLWTASLWVFLEFMRARMLTGFPWCLLGYSQYRYLDLIQIADVAGVYGLSFLIVLSNAVIYALLFDRPLSKRRFLGWELPIILLLLGGSLTYGRLSPGDTRDEGGRPVRVAVIQGNIDQSVKWDPAYQERTVSLYENLTRSSAAFRPDLVVWPETSSPFFFQDPAPLSRRILDLAGESGAALLIGSPAYGVRNSRTVYHNRSYLISNTGKVSGYYDKVHLVPFGEYVPLERFLPFVHRLVPAAGDFVPGLEVAPLKHPSFCAGVLVCFEVIFPELARQQVRKGADILVNQTNDAWFGMTGAPHQHMAMATFRAVENGRFLVRAANTGISAVVDPRGRILDHSDLFVEAVLTREIKAADLRETLYTRYGDFFAIFLSVISIVKIFVVLCYKKRLRDSR